MLPPVPVSAVDDAHIAPPATPAPRCAAGPGTPPSHARPAGDLFEGAAWTFLSLVCDAPLFVAAAFGASHVAGASPSSLAVALLVVLALGSVLRLAARGMYGERPARMSLLDQTTQAVIAVSSAAVVALAAAALLGAGTAAAQALAWSWLFTATGAAGARLILGLARHRARRRGRSGKRTLIIGAGLIGVQLERRLRAMPELGLIPLGFVDGDPAPADLTGQTGRGPILGSPEDLEEIVARTGAEHIIVAFSSAPDSTLQPLLRRCQRLGLEVSLVPRLFENVNERHWVEHIGGLPLVGLRQTDPFSWHFAAKHAVDRLAAAAMLALLSPVFAACAAAVRLSSRGPIFYRQRRIGRDGQHFDIFKFRSMRIAAPADEATLRALVAAGSAPGGVEGTDRRTRVGTFLRRSSLDELPQLVNVLLGHMSLVGPRPERPEFVELFGTSIRRYGDRHFVKSGMTGWAQVHGLRGQTSLTERVEWDNWYIQNWSLFLDLKILLMTPLAVVRAPSEGPAEPAPAQAPLAAAEAVA